ncbi:arginine and glutamate-rich protein 1-B-like [Diabrotica virgifera virgifera]|uniref:Uncharacterized protein n=1 Tax=Diabrotica virgifera virgifera TaxID=50390 RepID=A0ABM5L982_DIAVI|nr:arginine and glutamate-rich protein 1-B-like [Diabrotica virgifera virgifera]
MNSFERELVRRHDRQQKMNRSTVANQSTLIEEKMKEYSENEKEQIGEKQSQEEEVDNIKEGWQSIEESVLATIFLDEYQDGEIINNKKRKAESMERINDLKRERLEESIRFPNESKQEKINRKLEELNTKLEEMFNKLSEQLKEKVEMDTDVKKLIGIIKSTNNKKGEDSTNKKTPNKLKCDHCKLKVEQERQKQEQEKIKRALNMGRGKKLL